MKKLLTIFALMLVAFTANAQSCPDNNHPHMIDLGLPSGTKWACCNVGADKPEAYGGYYAWGETEEKDYYDWSTYTHCNGSESTCHDLGSDIAGTQYDVAHVKWGGSWVMPSKEQQDELRVNCTCEWTTVNGVYGGRLTSKINGGSIFLPAAGDSRNGSLFDAGSNGYYWSSAQHPSYSNYAYGLGLNLDGVYWYYGFGHDRGSGQSVRPVCSVAPVTNLCPDNHHPHMIDLGLPSGTKWACCNVGADKPEGLGGHYAWGETEERDDYSYFEGARWDDTDIQASNYDVAYVKWGSQWHMPNNFYELINNCSQKSVTINGVNGMLLTGLNGNSIFLPIAGRYEEDGSFNPNYSIYWESDGVESMPGVAYCAWLSEGNISCGDWWKYTGGSVRPVSVNSSTSNGQIVMERKLFVHHNGNYCHPCIFFLFDNDKMLTLGYFNTNYEDSHGIHIISSNTNETTRFSYDCLWEGRNTKDWYVAPNILDEWFTEKIVINTDGRVQYYLNNNYMGEEVFSDLNLNEASSFKIKITPYGWWTQHYTYMDDFYLSTPATTISDNFNDGVIDLDIWNEPINPDGVREEDGIIKMEQLRTDQDFNLYIDDIPLCAEQKPKSTIRGDVNGDKAINITDVAMMTTHILGDFNKDFLSANADLNNDGDINITDVVTAVNIILTGKGVSSIELPEGAEISASDLTIYSDGEQVDAGDNGLLGACVGDIMVFNGDSLVYLSYGSQSDDRTLNSLETAISLLLPIIPFAVTDMDDNTFWLLKQMIGHLEQTRQLASAIDQSIIDKGYLDMDAVKPQYVAAVAELERRFGIDGSMSSYSPRMKIKNTTNPFFLNAGKEMQGGGVFLIKDHSIWGSGEKGNCWKSEFTVLNADRWCYTSLTKCRKNEHGYFVRQDKSVSDTFTNLIKPNNVSAFMDWGTFSDLATDPKHWLTSLTDPDFDRFASQFWEPLKNLGQLLRGEEMDITTFDKVKISGIKFDLYPQNDHLMLLGPGDDEYLQLFNYLKIVACPFLKMFISELKKSNQYDESETFDKLMILFLEWMCKDATFVADHVIAKVEDTSLPFSKRYLEPLEDIVGKFFEFCVDEEVLDNLSESIYDNFINRLPFWQQGFDDPQVKALFTAYKTTLTVGDIVLFLLDSNFEGDAFEIDYGPSYESYHEEQYEDYTVGDVTFRMMKLPGGPFMMGAEPDDKDAADNEKPLHYVNLNGFYIGETEVTQNLWEAVMCDENVYNNPSTFNNFLADRPVNNVTWEECQEFIRRLNILTNRTFRLPTEAEWEFAATGGMYKRGYPYAGGSNANEVAWCGRTETHGVKELKANEFKLYDMSGNVAEWCQDYYDSKYYKNSPEDDPCNNTDGTAGARVYRGGGFKSEGKDCRVSARAGNISSVRSDLIGLRLALDGTQLVLSTKHVYLAKGGECAVDILSGSGKYTVESKDEAVATAVIDDRAAKCKVRITAHSVEETTITVSDTETGQTVEIVVIVNPAQTFTVNGVSFRMVEVDGDTFWMGAADDDPEANSDERPIHLVALSNFSIGETEVTQALWNAVMGENPSNFDYLGGDNPVENVSWNDCQIFISKLKEKTGKNFRLPTEAEWEFAARAGKNNEVTKYAGSNDIDAVAWYVKNSQSYTHPVASKLANRWGLFDMTGNVWEWCQDSYAENYYSTSPSIDPCNTAEVNNHVARGGSWADTALGCRLVFRGNAPADRRDGDTGLRLVLDDGEVVMPLGLSTNTLTLTMGQQETVDVTSGSGSYAAVSNATSVATVTVEGSKLIITAVSSGNATITVKDNQTQERAKIEVTVSDTPQAYLTCPDGNHPHLIDLGLPSGTKWACCNVDDDASKQSPTNYGGYYAWGETQGKDYYDWSTYTHCDGSYDTCHDLGSDIAGTQYDVAHVQWGGSWVMPSKEQQDELRSNCTYTWTTLNGVNGGQFTGSNGGTIFLPAAGHRWKSRLYGAGSDGYYWSSTQHPSDSYGACSLRFYSGYVDWDGSYRGYGFTVRPVSR